MTTDERVIELFTGANPVPDDREIVPPSDASSYLAELERRESTVTLITNHDQDRDQAGRRSPRPDPHGREHRRIGPMLVAAAAAIALVVAGLVYLVNRDGTDEIPADVPAPAPEEGQDEPIEAPAEIPVVPSDAANPLPERGVTTAARTYWSDQLGVAVEFTLPEPLLVTSNAPAWIGMIGGYEGISGDYPVESGTALAMYRWAGWSTAEESEIALNLASTEVASIDPYDVDGWLAANDLVVRLDETTEVADRPTRMFEVTVDPETDQQTSPRPEGCTEEWTPCFHFGETTPSRAPRSEWVSAQRVTRFYLITIEDAEPLLISVGAPPDSSFIEEIESTVIESLVIAEDVEP